MKLMQSDVVAVSLIGDVRSTELLSSTVNHDATCTVRLIRLIIDRKHTVTYAAFAPSATAAAAAGAAIAVAATADDDDDNDAGCIAPKSPTNTPVVEYQLPLIGRPTFIRVFSRTVLADCPADRRTDDRTDEGAINLRWLVWD